MMQRRNNQQPSCLVSNWCVYFVSRVVGCCDVNCSPDMGFLICTKAFSDSLLIRLCTRCHYVCMDISSTIS